MGRLRRERAQAHAPGPSSLCPHARPRLIVHQPLHSLISLPVSERTGRHRTKEMPVPRSSRYKLSLASELPDTLKRSSMESQEAFTRALANAVQAYGGGDYAVRARLR
jgi:hypothetical protein